MNKGFEAPSAAALLVVVRASGELRSEWANMLGHQLPALPAVDQILDRVPQLLGWLDEPASFAEVEDRPAALAPKPTETLFAPRGGYYWGGGQRLEIVRFAGANRLMVEFTYSGKRRLVEPYSLRRKDTGNLLLYAWEQGATSIKAFKTADMRDVQATSVPFVPRYLVEFTGG